MNKILLITITIFPLFLFMSCPNDNTPLEIITDTTSHDFVWEIDTLGNYGSILYDVAVIDSNDIWVVGKIKTDSANYNVCHWDGLKWEFIKVLLGGTGYAINYFNEEDIWIILEGMPTHWNGNEWTFYHLQNMGINISPLNSIWGTSSDNMYFVGDNGSIVHYDGSNFEKIEISRDTKLIDISGTANGDYVFITGYDLLVPVSTIALEIHDQAISEIYYGNEQITYSENNIFNYMEAVDVYDNIAYISTTNGLWKYDFIAKKSEIINNQNVYNIACQSIIAQNHNDILLVEIVFGFAHYNGNDWNRESEIDNDFIVYSGKLVGDIAVFAGYKRGYEYALVGRGKRN